VQIWVAGAIVPGRLNFFYFNSLRFKPQALRPCGFFVLFIIMVETIFFFMSYLVLGRPAGTAVCDGRPASGHLIVPGTGRTLSKRPNLFTQCLALSLPERDKLTQSR